MNYPATVVKWAIAVAAVICALVVIGLLVGMGGHGKSGEQKAFGDFCALTLLFGFTAGIAFAGETLGALVVGKDERVSTSKVQALIWTYAIGGVLFSILASSWVGYSGGYDKITKAGFEWAPYLILLGGPFLAAVAARGLVGSQVAGGQSAKPPDDEATSIKQVFTDDEGDTDLIDSQYLLFNLIAVVFFLVSFLRTPSDGLPTIPTILYLLTGASALGYVTNKAIPSGAPTIKSISPATQAPGGMLVVNASQLLFPLNPTEPGPPEGKAKFQGVTIQIDGREADIPMTAGAVSSPLGADRIEVKVPDLKKGHKNGDEVDVTALNFRGDRSNAVKLKLQLG
jgi:hypothetical protein